MQPMAPALTYPWMPPSRKGGAVESGRTLGLQSGGACENLRFRTSTIT
jgi:hypothetical protein